MTFRYRCIILPAVYIHTYKYIYIYIYKTQRTKFNTHNRKKDSNIWKWYYYVISSHRLYDTLYLVFPWAICTIYSIMPNHIMCKLILVKTQMEKSQCVKIHAMMKKLFSQYYHDYNANGISSSHFHNGCILSVNSHT